jgi:RNA polymerase sigma-70 factor (ECF subfamily)
MAETPSVRTTDLHAWVDRLRAGDRAAADELLRAVGGRLEGLARRMLKGFPNVKRWADTGDVLQGAAMRLLRTLERIRPDSTRDFFNLAAVHVRRELLDLARHFGGPQGVGANHASAAPGADAGPPAYEAAAPAADTADLDRWVRFHEAVERLPAAEREVVGLAFYHGWTHEQIAELLQVTDRTVRRYWQAACLRLSAEVGGRLPDVGGPAD